MKQIFPPVFVSKFCFLSVLSSFYNLKFHLFYSHPGTVFIRVLRIDIKRYGPFLWCYCNNVERKQNRQKRFPTLMTFWCFVSQTHLTCNLIWNAVVVVVDDDDDDDEDSQPKYYLSYKCSRNSDNNFSDTINGWFCDLYRIISTVIAA